MPIVVVWLVLMFGNRKWGKDFLNILYYLLKSLATLDYNLVSINIEVVEL